MNLFQIKAACFIGTEHRRTLFKLTTNNATASSDNNNNNNNNTGKLLPFVFTTGNKL